MPSRSLAMSTTSIFADSLRPAPIAEDGDGAGTACTDESVLQELDIELEQKTLQMTQLVERLTASVEAKLRTELIKLPKSIQTMSMRDFCVRYGGDINKAMEPPPAEAARALAPQLLAPSGLGIKGGPTKAMRPAPASARKRGAETPSMVPTPGGGRSTRARLNTATPSGGPSSSRVAPASSPGSALSQPVPFTPRDAPPRPLQQGESEAFSANGSPIQVPGTLKSKSVRAGPANVAVLTLGDGSELELGLSELEKLKAQVDAHMNAIKANIGLEQ